MVILLLAIILGAAFLVWLWKVPIKKMANAMKESGSSTFEAYAIIFLLLAGLTGAVYMISRVI
ncbi:hypothetical protein [Fodinibius halophilus]|uniref:Uncharacterized protein n=1 Tax=Fodinibius halophilus TaxID=1736908 RepID=A0A6M1T7L7_9BACT|nr:hypothetical protein [Fodinibius halophilus]NGP89395.1 hypothetical protein [Fodinibius halophilus]